MVFVIFRMILALALDIRVTDRLTENVYFSFSSENVYSANIVHAWSIDLFYFPTVAPLRRNLEIAEQNTFSGQYTENGVHWRSEFENNANGNYLKITIYKYITSHGIIIA